MAVSGSSSPMAKFVAEAPNEGEVHTRRRVQVVEAWQADREPSDAVESRLRRRARRQALALMVASSLASVLALYAMWVLLRAVI